MNDYFTNIPSAIQTIGSLAVALTVIAFFWNLIQYIFFGGDDIHRAHAKLGAVNATTTLVLLMLLWWGCSAAASALGI